MSTRSGDDIKSGSVTDTATAPRPDKALPKGSISLPAISLPKGGGAIRSMGEKFAANPVNGGGSMSVPIAVSPGRAGFAPQLSLSYDSGSGNGPFGFGWRLSLPAITRKTEKGLPRYQDDLDSDLFILSGAEDLVPALNLDGTRQVAARTEGGINYRIHGYIPRTEGLFSRIERWSRLDDGTMHWRALSTDNILSLYGKDNSYRIADPADPSRIFTWLLCETRDDKGNAVLYEYRAEDSQRVDPLLMHEKNRTPASRSAQRHIKSILYGNRVPLLDSLGRRPVFLTPPEIQNAGWMFQVIFDYGEHDLVNPKPKDSGTWNCRHDPFSDYRAGFEVRSYRLCRRILMFHHFLSEPELGADCLVRSTDFLYRDIRSNPADCAHGHPLGSFLASVTACGYVRDGASGYRKQSLPPLEFEYSRAIIDETVRDIELASLENLPSGIDGARYQWVDLDGEGIPGILSEQAGAWYFKPGLGNGRFGAMKTVANKPSLAELGSGRQQWMDLAGDASLDLADFSGPVPGFYERTEDENWDAFKPFRSLPNIDWSNPNLRFVDLNGDGHADLMITEQEVFTWYPSLEEDGFEPAVSIPKSIDEEKGPRLIFADGVESIFLADMSGSGLSDLVRIRNGEICYWPNLGYGRFGARIVMDDSPWFDHPEHFSLQRVRLADIDSSGCNDILYLGSDRVSVYFNESGNGWSAEQRLRHFPQFDSLAVVNVADLLGNGTACLIWSSPVPSGFGRQMRYIDLMGGSKPNLLIKSINNLGAETRVHYVSSTKFYLQDKQAGRPWITRLPFPVHVVERIETIDRISRNRFATLLAYHHGHFDGHEREFRGFGMVEQWDTEEIPAMTAAGTLPPASNLDFASQVPPVHTKTWFHTGVHQGRGRISDFFSGSEYFREPGLTEQQARELHLPDTVLPGGLSLEEEREACRALRGPMIRQEVYALDKSPKAAFPYIVTEQNFTVKRIQPRGSNPHAVFLTHPREAVTYHYERNPSDPRVMHALTLRVDDFGNVLQSASVAYGRRMNAADAGMLPQDRVKQRLVYLTCTENAFTNLVSDDDSYRVPLLAESRNYEIRKAVQDRSANGLTTLLKFDELLAHLLQAGDGTHDIAFEDVDFARAASAAAASPIEDARYFRRVLTHSRVLYRKNDLTSLLPLFGLESRALPGESFKMAFTPGLISGVYQRPRAGQPPEILLPNPSQVLSGPGGDRGGYVPSQSLRAAGSFPSTDPNDHWWIPSGRIFHSPGPGDSVAQEVAFAQSHFFAPVRFRDAFGQTASAIMDVHDLLLLETRDPLGNRVTVGERKPDGTLDAARHGNDYRVLQARLVMDPNRNRTAVAFDALGSVAGTAVMGKPEENLGDSLAGFQAVLPEADVLAHMANPFANPGASLGGATTRVVYDLFAYHRSRIQPNPEPARACSLVRETHVPDLAAGASTRIQQAFSYSDGFGREIQKKVQAEPVPAPAPVPRWVGSGWTIFNNKGNPVRQFEPSFSATHRFEFGLVAGVSPILFYDPVQRVVATLHPNHSYERVVFDPWRQKTFDVNDTSAADPRTDADISGVVRRYFDTQPATWKTWHAQRQGGALGPEEQAAAARTASHADTPAIAHFDSLGRAFLAMAHHGFRPDGSPILQPCRVEMDIEGRHREVRDPIVQNGDAVGRLVMRSRYDMAGNPICMESMEAGARWMLADAGGKPIRSWNSRGHLFRTEYDSLRRPVRIFVTGADASNPGRELLTERLVYGEQHPRAESLNLRGRAFLHLDQAGVAVGASFDFKDNALHTARRLAKEYRKALDWRPVDADPLALPPNGSAKIDLLALEALIAPRLEPETYSLQTTFDALNRPLILQTPDNSLVRPAYNVAGLLEKVEANLRGEQLSGVPVWTSFVAGIEYDPRGRRTRVDYGNAALTNYAYDPLTSRLTQLVTQRDPAIFANDCPLPPPAGWPGCQIQNLHYTYDAAGNITHIRDEAQQTLFFRNKRVEPNAEYTYDPLYRLIEAKGREHLGQAPGAAPSPHSYNDHPRIGVVLSASDGNAMARYLERFFYDAAGNFESMQHVGTDPANPGWTRSYTYGEATQLEPGKRSNRLTNTIIGSTTETYSNAGDGYDAHGNMQRLPQLQMMQWDYKDQMHMSSRQAVNASDLEGVPRHGERTWYVYDSGGQRVRKVTELSGGSVKDERIYLGGFEIYRRRGSNPLVRETLHLLDGKQRIALVETRTQGSEPAVPARIIRYQFGNHLGSASLELDGQSQIISYEEYTPYGSTSYQAVRSQTETPKRFRYSGKERDEESGLYYYGARYLAPWLGRWVSCDPAGTVDGLNLFIFVKNNPIVLCDSNGLQSDPVVVSDIAFDIEHPETTGVSIKDWKKKTTTKMVPVKKGMPSLRITTEFIPPNGVSAPLVNPWYQTEITHDGKLVGTGDEKFAHTPKSLQNKQVFEQVTGEHFQLMMQKHNRAIKSFSVTIGHGESTLTLGKEGGFKALLDVALGKKGAAALKSVGLEVDRASLSQSENGNFEGTIRPSAKAVVKSIGIQFAVLYSWGAIRQAAKDRVSEVRQNPIPTPEDIEFMEGMGYKMIFLPDERLWWEYDPGFVRTFTDNLYEVLTMESLIKQKFMSQPAVY